MTWICWRGIELSARTQQALLAMEFVTLVVFAVVALVDRLRQPTRSRSRRPRYHSVGLGAWFDPFVDRHDAADRRRPARGLHLLGLGHVRHRQRGDRGRRPSAGARGDRLDADAARLIYLLVTIAAQAVRRHRAAQRERRTTSSAAGSARGARLGARQAADHRRAHLRRPPRRRRRSCRPRARRSRWRARRRSRRRSAASTSASRRPTFSTIVMGGVSIVWYVAIVNISSNVLGDSITGLGFAIAFYYGLTGLRLRDLLPPRAASRACAELLLRRPACRCSASPG